MGLEVLVPVLVGALLRVVGKVGDGVLSAVEEQSKQAANGVVAKLRAWWSRDKVASDELERFQAEPDMYRPIIEARLVKKLTAEPDMQCEFETLVTGMGPQVEVFQKIARANGVTGARIEELVRGQVHVQQQMDTAENVVGADIKRLGG
jgi:hypothetical protein